jgi:predicted RNase H-like HicB family nuclease
MKWDSTRMKRTNSCGGDPVHTVTLVYHREAEGWWAESPEIKGFVAGGDTLAEARAMAEEGVRFYLDEPVEIEIIEILPEGFTVLGIDTKPGSLITVSASGTSATAAVQAIRSPAVSQRVASVMITSRSAEAARSVTSSEGV